MASYSDYAPTQRFWPALATAPDGTAVAYVADAGGQLNLVVQDRDAGSGRPLTHGTDWSVRQVAWSLDSRTLFFTADRDGDEYFQVFSVRRDGTDQRQLTDAPKAAHYLAPDPVSPDGRFLAYAGNDREPTDQDVLLRDLGSGEVRRLVDSGGFLEPGHWSSDSGALTVQEARSNTDVAVSVARLDGTVTPLLEGRPGKHVSVGWLPGDRHVVLRTDLDRDFMALVRVSVDDGTVTWLHDPGWDVEHAALVAGGTRAVVSVNVDGVSRLSSVDLPAAGPGAGHAVHGVPAGTVDALSAASDGGSVAVLMATGARPENVGIVDLTDGHEPGHEPLRWLTGSRPQAADPAGLVEPELVHYPTHDGREIPAYLFRPAGAGPHGVLLSIHGGPEFQERPRYSYSGFYQYLLSHGVAVLAPNVRGSTGYGTAYQKLIHHDWGGDELKDFEHAHRWLSQQDWVDSARIGVFGGSFGGFATLSCVSRLPGRWAAAVSIVGPSNLVTFASAVPPTWRRLMAAWVGDVETERDFLLERSPITYADDIDTPLFVIQGANDQRVVQSESDQIVERLRERGVDVRYDVYPDEGHGFAKRANEAKAFSDSAEFLLGYLAADATPTT